MADGFAETSLGAFPEADAVAELNPGLNKNLQADATPAEIAATSKDIKEQADIARNKKNEKDGVQKLKSAVIISGVVVAVIGAIFAITKKLREK
ncbi:uncharacterized protein LOC122669229 [Telopea speciosissima]|uniref:uncharacterized protein LOC122669229 n=1 Tax=Telopea speciosissima TaxID=54955 RepID=UPI001CC3715E|nr:uncharacterized protein LOC122669229 [Telopea speciosissima]